LIVYSLIFPITFLLLVPLTPFSPNIHPKFTHLMLIIFIITTIYTWTAFPFTSEAPFKLMFKQTVFLQPRERYPGRYPSKVAGVLTTLTGLEDVLKHRIISELPSASVSEQVSCAPSAFYPGLHDCSWQTPSSLMPDNGKRSQYYPQTWITVTATSLGLNRSSVSVAGYNSRNCRLYFDNQNVTSFLVDGANADRKMQAGYPISGLGTNQIRLWSRTWSRVFSVEVEHPQWPRRGLRARAACEWNEYESGIIGIDNGPESGRERGNSKIPAFEEVLRWLPKWAVVVKGDDGLVEAVQELNA
jgi:hypothetical protein